MKCKYCDNEAVTIVRGDARCENHRVQYVEMSVLLIWFFVIIIICIVDKIKKMINKNTRKK